MGGEEMVEHYFCLRISNAPTVPEEDLDHWGIWRGKGPLLLLVLGPEGRDPTILVFLFLPLTVKEERSTTNEGA